MLQIGAITRTTANKIAESLYAGDGRFDIGLIPREERYPGIIMELKWKKDLGEDKLAGLADEALGQNKFQIFL